MLENRRSWKTPHETISCASFYGQTHKLHESPDARAQPELAGLSSWLVGMSSCFAPALYFEYSQLPTATAVNPVKLCENGLKNRVPCKVGTILAVDRYGKARVHAPMTAFEASCDGGDVPRLRRRRRRLPPVASTIPSTTTTTTHLHVEYR